MATAVPVTKRQRRPNQPRQTLASWLLPPLSSTVGSKFLVALTGLVLTAFVVGHMSGHEV